MPLMSKREMLEALYIIFHPDSPLLESFINFMEDEGITPGEFADILEGAKLGDSE